MYIKLHDLFCSNRSDVFYHNRHLQRFLCTIIIHARRHIDICNREGRITQAKAKRKKRFNPLIVIISVSDKNSFSVIDMPVFTGKVDSGRCVPVSLRKCKGQLPGRTAYTKQNICHCFCSLSAREENAHKCVDIIHEFCQLDRSRYIEKHNRPFPRFFCSAQSPAQHHFVFRVQTHIRPVAAFLSRCTNSYHRHLCFFLNFHGNLLRKPRQFLPQSCGF